MLDSNVALMGLALVLGILVARRGAGHLRAALQAAFENLLAIMPRLCVALILAGFIAKLIPAEAIGHMLGYDTGWRGIALACVFGGMMPSGPMIAFPIVVVLRLADAGAPQIVAFLTAWSVFAWHRVLVYEVGMLGWHFTLVRLAASVVLPATGGAIALGLCTLTGMR